MAMPPRGVTLVEHADTSTYAVLLAVSEARQALRRGMDVLIQPTDLVLVAVPAGQGTAAKEAILRGAVEIVDDFEVRADPRLGR